VFCFPKSRSNENGGKAELRVFLAGYSVAMVAYCVTKMILPFSPVIGQFLDTMIVATIDKEWL